ncbi:unnamed protein product [Timema podura]|uniref:Secreted protein n=1 Tax=Timema podura TaxID=61482 RepID=A0ABN7NPJ1_TIMPD|nr:unnamed protein product [Timema podura]
MKLLGFYQCAIAMLICLLSFVILNEARPYINSEHTLQNMRQIPQWHCLRYRRFDLVRRCRNHRLLDSRILKEHMPEESTKPPKKSPIEPIETPRQSPTESKESRDVSTVETVGAPANETQDSNKKTDDAVYETHLVFVSDHDRPNLNA